MSTTNSMRIPKLDLHNDASCVLRSVTVLDRRQSQKQLLTCKYAREVPNDNPCGILVTSQAAPSPGCLRSGGKSHDTGNDSHVVSPPPQRVRVDC